MADPQDDLRHAALSHYESHGEQYLEALKELVRIPSVSTAAAPDPEVQRSAAAIADLLGRSGFEHVEVLELPGAHPYVYADWLHAPDAPTILLYGHHDVQPPGRPEKWITPAFEPTVRDGRLYGRGAVDDKAGIMAHVAACDAWMKTAGRLPINVKVVIEGEEEVGSTSLERFLTEYRPRLDADVLVLTDTANLDTGIPALTVALRGLVGIEVEVAALDHPLHSGMWGGPLPDPVIGLSRAIAALVDQRGRLVPSIAKNVRPLDADERTAMDALPFSEEEFRAQAGLLAGAELIGNSDVPVYARLWREPAVTVVAFEARPIEGSSNQIIESARARISVRIVPDMQPEEVENALVAHFEKGMPWGLSVKVTREGRNGWWLTEPKGPAFAAAARALELGYGKRLEHIGCGGSIPFVEPFAKVLGGIPALLLGVEDPICNAHGENESLHIGDFQKSVRSAIHLYAELASR